MNLARVPSWLLLSLALAGAVAAARGAAAVRLPSLTVAGGAAWVIAARRRGAETSRPRVELLSRVSVGPRATAALLSVDGAGWLVVVGEGCAQLARAELAPDHQTPDPRGSRS